MMRRRSVIATVAALVATGGILFLTDMFGAGSVRKSNLDHPACVLYRDGTSDALPDVATESQSLLGQCIDQVALRGGAILADVIHADAASAIDLAFTHDFTPLQAAIDSGNPQAITDDLGAQANEVKKNAAEAFRKPRAASGSDFVGALIVAGERLSQTDFQNRPRMIVVVGNMLQNTPGLRFLTTPLTNRRIDALIETLRRQGRVAPLQRIKVVVVGAGLTTRPLTAQQQVGLKRFYYRYVEASGGHITMWVPSLTTLPQITR